MTLGSNVAVPFAEVLADGPQSAASGQSVSLPGCLLSLGDPIVRDLPLEASVGFVVKTWRSAEDGLFLHVRGHQEEVRLVSRCGRCHWIVREEYRVGGPKLVVTCHSCGERMTYALVGGPAEVP